MLPFRPLAGLAQNEELGCAGHEARSGRRLGQMSRRKSEITGHSEQQSRRDIGRTTRSHIHTKTKLER
jgi:hypothetical protein